MNNLDKAKEIANSYEDDECDSLDILTACMGMARWKDEQFNLQLSNLKDEIQSNLRASSGFNDEYSRGYQDCGMKVMEMIDKILEL